MNIVYWEDLMMELLVEQYFHAAIIGENTEIFFPDSLWEMLNLKRKALAELLYEVATDELSPKRKKPIPWDKIKERSYHLMRNFGLVEKYAAL